ncbi:MAG: YggS family pyridoxal phosphate-dependent enzyme [Nitrospirae bacterium]|nr:YggS family pyridoxal phosphate-dependent enzyme [Nitrospirota bacterium]MBI3593841.1 YggS family pyridoxal phosphate-dependent enzyme [Nitrospirota bacterium]
MTVKANLDLLSRKISESARRSGRSVSDIHLVAVTKTVSPEKVIESLQKGIQILGENRVQEALPRMDLIRSKGYTPEWHFIGKLQRNKVRQVVGRFSLIHSVDSLNLAEEISRQAEIKGTHQDILIEMNLSGETTKAGFTSGELLSQLDRINRLNYVKLRGLMTIPPRCSVPEDSRPYFRKLRSFGEEVDSRLGKICQIFSMGMSDDFEVAIEEGATHIRIGRSLFGERLN